jgi:spore coat polysaccharide biosynthesis protein SpsF
MGSTRLPGKTLIDVAGKPMLQHVVERLSRAELIDEVVVATSTHPNDEVILALCERLDIRGVAGSEEDVLERYAHAAVAAQADVVARVTADCPLIDPELSDQVVAWYVREEADYAANCIATSFPRGFETEVFSAKRLAEVALIAEKPYEREHVTPYFYQHPERFRLAFLDTEAVFARADLRLVVDTPEDLELIRTIYARLGQASNHFSIRDVMRLLDRQPELRTINAAVRQKKLGE